MNELQPLLDLLSAKYGWLPALLVWMSTVGSCFKLVSAQLQARMTDMLVSAAGDKDETEDSIWVKVLDAPAYRAFAFTLDFLLRVKLPRLSDFLALKKK